MGKLFNITMNDDFLLFEYENSNFRSKNFVNFYFGYTLNHLSRIYIYIYTFQIRFANLHTSIYSTFVGTFIERL